MKTVYKIRSAKKAIEHGFNTGDFSGADAIENNNNSVLADVFKRVQLGLSEYAYINTGDRSGGLIYIISRDTVQELAVRVSVFVRYDSGENMRIYASSHSTHCYVKDFLNNCGLPSGRLVVVGGWYDNLKGGALNGI